MQQFADSCDHYATADAGGKYAAVHASVTVTANGRNSTSCLQLSNTNQNIDIPVAGSPTTVFFNFALFSSAAFGDQYVVQIRESDNGHIGIRIASDGSVNVRRDTPSGTQTLLATSAAGIFTVGSYVTIQGKVTIHDTTGYVELRKDGSGTPFLTFTGDTRTSGFLGVVTGIRLCGVNNAANTVRFDDIVVWDDVNNGDGFHDWLGELEVRAHFPNGAGANAGFTRGGADSGANWSQQEETAANGDTDYIFATTAATKDTYAMEAYKATGKAILGIQAVSQAKKVEPGTAEMGAVYRIGGVDYPPAAGEALALTYSFTRQFNGVSPATGVLFTEAELNALEAGPYKSA